MHSFSKTKWLKRKRKQKLAHNLGVQEKKTKVTEHLGGKKTKVEMQKGGQSWPLWKENKS
jgi:hypothetical protein